MDRFVEDSIRNCTLCAQHDKTAVATTAPLQTTPWPQRPWEKLAIDIRGPDNSVGQEYRFAVVVIDYHSKWVEVELMAEVTARRVIQMLHRLFHREGVPECVVSDNGVQFTSREFVTLLAEYGVQHQKTPVYHPMANGLVERFNRTLGGFLTTARQLGGNIQRRIIEMVGAYNATPQATTNRSPAELLHGRPMRSRLDVKRPEKENTGVELRERVEKRQAGQKLYADQRRAAVTKEFAPGDWVRVKKPSCAKGERKYGEPLKIVEKKG